MGYRSDIRIKLRKTDFEDLRTKFNNQYKENKDKIRAIEEEIKKLPLEDLEKRRELNEKASDLGMSPLFNNDNIDILDERKDVILTDEQLMPFDYDIEEETDIVYFGWNSLKWYDEYADVQFIMNFVRNCDYYSIGIIGEEVGDIKRESKGMYDIGIYSVFEEDE